MATPTITTSRRALLGAIAVAPVLSLPSVSAAAPPSVWQAAVAKQKLTSEAHSVACRAHSFAQEQYFKVKPVLPYGQRFMPDDTAEKFNARWQATKAAHERADFECRARFRVDETEAESGEALEEADAALHELLATPAPDLRAVVTKLELAEHYCLEIYDIAPVLDDLRRFARMGDC